MSLLVAPPSIHAASLCGSPVQEHKGSSIHIHTNGIILPPMELGIVESSPLKARVLEMMLERLLRLTRGVRLRAGA